jgi:hypothetical protein
MALAEGELMENGLLVALVQGGYYFLSGIWPLVSIGTFQKITGPKHDLWLVKTVGLIIAVIGAALLVAGALGELTPATAVLAVGSGAGLGIVEVIYVKKGVIAPIYLLDTVAESLLLAWWAHTLL